MSSVTFNSNPGSDSPTKRHQIGFPILLVLFSMGVVLPLLYGVASSFFDAMQMKPPLLTQAVMAVPPLVMTGLAVMVSIGLILASFWLTPSRFKLVSWLTVGVVVAVSLVGVFAFLSPFYSVVSSLKN